MIQPTRHAQRGFKVMFVASVSIAIHEPLYRSGPNDWSGQPEGLTYQRAIRALDNYGHFAEVTLLGRKLIDAINRGGDHFPQQFDPTTGLATIFRLFSSVIPKFKIK